MSKYIIHKGQKYVRVDEEGDREAKVSKGLAELKNSVNRIKKRFDDDIRIYENNIEGIKKYKLALDKYHKDLENIAKKKDWESFERKLVKEQPMLKDFGVKTNNFHGEPGALYLFFPDF